MRIAVIVAGLLGAVSVMGFAGAKIGHAATGSSSGPSAMQAPENSEPAAAWKVAGVEELRRIKKRKAKPKSASGAKLALPARCAGGGPNTAARPVC